MTGKRKLEPPLKLDLSFDEALSRFAATEPKEVVESIERSKTKKPPQDTPPRRPGCPKRRALEIVYREPSIHASRLSRESSPEELQ